MGPRGSLKGNKEYIELNENKNITCQDMWEAANAVRRGKYAVPTA